jgi:membrane fusion protein (multidrug efflux system)
MSEHELPTAPEPAVDHDGADTGDTSETPTTPRRRLGGWRRWALGAAALVLLATGAFFVSGRDANGDEAKDGAAAEEGEGKEEKPPVPVEVETVATGDVSSYLTATANLVAEGEVKVLAEVEGRVARVTVEEGQSVAPRQLLAVLDRGDAEIALEKARVRQENAQSVFQRGLELAKDQLISREDLDKREMDARITRQERAEAEWRLAKTEIRAPIGGRISLRTTQVGQHVRPGDEMYQITDFDPLVARLYLPERDVLGLATGRTVELSLDAASQVVFAGRIRQISPVVDTATGTVKVTIEAVRPPAEVRPGSFVTARIVRQRHADAVVLPKDAVVRELKEAHVFVAVADGDGLKAARREVTLGLEEDGRVEVLAGVTPGERLVVAGQGALKDGSRIRLLDDPAQEG